MLPETKDQIIENALLAATIIEAGAKRYAKLSVALPIPLEADCNKNIGFLKNFTGFSFAKNFAQKKR